MGREMKISANIPSHVKVLAVSKLQPTAKIRALYEKGYRHFGENYPQELVKKQNELKDLKVSWHLIGHLQKNKVKLVLGCELIHSVDSLSLAEEISKRAKSEGLQQKILLQINLAQESSKEGFNKNTLEKEFKKISELPHLEVCGLMTMPPFVQNSEENRRYFNELRQLLLKLKSTYKLSENFRELSMGTSQDYQVAIEEGATWIRLGTTLFGDRPAAKG
jgi:PLP dependent protein